ncbi:MAG: iron-containing alcohol dehydrogenase [Desulfuromonadaceae bacterium]|nr:iron-containing alcohol dehydrogenase [Desulfobulbus sp.]
MQNFTFYNPTKILFGKGCIADIAGEIPKESRVLITYGGGSIKVNGVFDAVRAALTGQTIFEFSGIEPNPTYETLMDAVSLVKKEKIDFLLAVGGGSVIDGTKFIAAAACFDGDPWDILARGAAVTHALPLASVLTLPATGSEMNCGSVITRKSIKAKLHFINPLVYPRFSALDPTTTYTLPVSQISNGVIDAFVHVMEQYLTYPVEAKVQDRFAEGLLLTLIEEGPRALQDPTNYETRANIMWSATLALNGLIGAGVPQDWATHMIGHEITVLHGLDHAQSLAIVFPAMMEVQRQQKSAKLLQYAERVWGIAAGSTEERISAAIEKTRSFFATMQVKSRMSEYGIGGEDVEKIIEQLEQHGMTALGERGDVTLDVSRNVLKLIL